jgi:hypothetical protein
MTSKRKHTTKFVISELKNKVEAESEILKKPKIIKYEYTRDDIPFFIYKHMDDYIIIARENVLKYNQRKLSIGEYLKSIFKLSLSEVDMIELIIEYDHNILWTNVLLYNSIPGNSDPICFYGYLGDAGDKVLNFEDEVLNFTVTDDISSISEDETWKDKINEKKLIFGFKFIKISWSFNTKDDVTISFSHTIKMNEEGLSIAKFNKLASMCQRHTMEPYGVGSDYRVILDIIDNDDNAIINIALFSSD